MKIECAQCERVHSRARLHDHDALDADATSEQHARAKRHTARSLGVNVVGERCLVHRERIAPDGQPHYHIHWAVPGAQWEDGSEGGGVGKRG